MEKECFYLYIFFLFLLIWASFYGHIGKGSRRWIEFLGFYIQPSEFMKIAIIMALAKFFDEKQIKDPRDYFFSFTNILNSFTSWIDFKTT